MNLNKVQLIGRTTRAPEVKALAGGTNVCSFSVATNRVWKNKEGAKQEETEFHNCVAFGRTAEVIGQYVVKGQEIYAEGRLQTQSWEDKKTGEKKYKTQIVIDKFEFGQKPKGAPQGGGAASTDEKTQSEIDSFGADAPATGEGVDDIPF